MGLKNNFTVNVSEELFAEESLDGIFFASYEKQEQH